MQQEKTMELIKINFYLVTKYQSLLNSKMLSHNNNNLGNSTVAFLQNPSLFKMCNLRILLIRNTVSADSALRTKRMYSNYRI